MKTHFQFWIKMNFFYLTLQYDTKTGIGTYCSVGSVVKGPFSSLQPSPLLSLSLSLSLSLNFLQWPPRPLSIRYAMYFYAGVPRQDDISCFFDKNLLSLSLLIQLSNVYTFMYWIKPFKIHFVHKFHLILF